MFEIASVKGMSSFAKKWTNFGVAKTFALNYGFPQPLLHLDWNLAYGEELWAWAIRILEWSEGEANYLSCCKMDENTLVIG